MDEGNLALQPVVPNEVVQNIGVAPVAVGEQLLLVQPEDVAVVEAVAEVLGQEVHGENVHPVDDEEPVDEEIIIVEGEQNVAFGADVAGDQDVAVPFSQSDNASAADFVFQSQVLQNQSLYSGALVLYKGKRTWDQAFSNQEGIVCANNSDPAVQELCLRPKLAIQLSQVRITDNVHGITGQTAVDGSPQSVSVVPLEVAHEDKGKQPMIESGTFSVGLTVDAHPKSRQKKKKVPVVVPGPRRFTRSQLLLDGHRATPLPGLCPRPRKKSKKRLVAESTGRSEGDEPAPSTPLPVLQQIGAMLDIDPALLTTEKLMAPVEADAEDKSVNDKGSA
jgi:hypothetical protein